MKNLISVFFRWALVIWSVFVFCFFAFSMKPDRYGDGFEYIYMTESFIQHNTPDLQENDFLIAQEKLKTQNNFSWFNNARSGFYQAKNEKYYSYHFWLYSLVVSPVQQVISVFHGNELRAFGITNALFYIAMLWVVFLYSPQKYRILLTGLMAFSPLVPYITWTHTEVFSATLVTMALVFWLRKNFKLAILLSALASCQNPPIAAFTVFVGCVYLWGVYKEYRNTKKIDLRDFVITGLCSLPIIFSPLFYYINFSTINLIKHLGLSDFSLISFHKFLSYFFDLNQGAILYSGLLLVVFLYYIIKNLLHKNFKYFELVLCAIVFVLLSLSAPNWNCGISVVLRYVVWTYPFLVFYVVYNINPEKQTFLKVLLLINMFALCSMNNWFKGNPDYLHNTSLANTVLSRAPVLYNPEHEIFAERLAQRELVQPYPSVFISEEGVVKKVLTDKSGWQTLRADNAYTIEDDYYEQELLKFKGEEPRYINVSDNKMLKSLNLLSIDKKIMFNERDDDFKGLSVKEDWGRWSDSKIVFFNLKFASIDRNDEFVSLKIDGHPFLAGAHKKVKVKIYLNDKHVSTWTFKLGQPEPEKIINIPMSAISQDNATCRIKFEIKNPVSPQKLGMGQDTRKLGFGFISFEVLNKTGGKK